MIIAYEIYSSFQKKLKLTVKDFGNCKPPPLNYIDAGGILAAALFLQLSLYYIEHQRASFAERDGGKSLSPLW